MIMPTEPTRHASYWLDKAVEIEAQGKPHSEAALRKAIKLDDAEHMKSPGSHQPPSLPRA